MITLISIFRVIQPETYITLFYNGHVVYAGYFRDCTTFVKNKYGKCGIFQMRALPDDHYMIYVVD